MTQKQSPVYLGIDIGTQSVRVGAFDHGGELLAYQAESITTFKNDQGHLSQSSTEIWQQFKKALAAIMDNGQIDADSIVSIGISATCSLVIYCNQANKLLGEQDIILWQCHRAKEQAQQINQLDVSVLKQLGGTISPEHELPKLMWLKQKRATVFAEASYFFDLADWMSFKLTGLNIRSICTTACKWGFNSHDRRWDDQFFYQVGLNELVDENYQRIGPVDHIISVGSKVGHLSAETAKALRLHQQTVVAAGMVDAHAGAVGVLGINISSEKTDAIDISEKLALIAGTSSCHMALSHQPHFVPGVWGPFPDVVLPNMSLTEGGISASGDLLHKIIHEHRAARGISEQVIHQQLAQTIDQLQQEMSLQWPEYLCQHLDVLPFFHGNRSPYADPNLRGSIVGLTMEGGLTELAKLYYATILALAYNDKAIIDAMNQYGHHIKAIIVTGGMAKNPLMLQASANAIGLPIILPQQPESVLLGCAMLARVAKTGENHRQVMAAMSQVKEVIMPSDDPSLSAFHQLKYQIFLRLKAQQDEIRLMWKQSSLG
ncbi:MAG: FGGY family pentulose kinase [Pseudomonadota bacterium]